MADFSVLNGADGVLGCNENLLGRQGRNENDASVRLERKCIRRSGIVLYGLPLILYLGEMYMTRAKVPRTVVHGTSPILKNLS